MGTETRYLIGPRAKLWKTGVSISSDVNGSAISTGEIKKHTHTFIIAIYIILLILVVSCFICNNIQTFVYDAFLLFAIQKRDHAHAEELQHAQHESPV